MKQRYVVLVKSVFVKNFSSEAQILYDAFSSMCQTTNYVTYSYVISLHEWKHRDKNSSEALLANGQITLEAN